MKVYGIKSCDTVRRALRELSAAGHAPELVDIRDSPLAPADIARFHDAFGLQPGDALYLDPEQRVRIW